MTARRSILPADFGCLSDAEHARLHHLDVATMTPREKWSEATLAEAELARRVFAGCAGVVVGYDGDWPISAEAWLSQRIAACRRTAA